MTLDRPVDLAAPVAQATDWKVLYGDRHQFKAYFDDKEKATQYALTHHGVVIPLRTF
jgi:hypothetical protein